MNAIAEITGVIDIAPADDLQVLPDRINAAVAAAETHARSAVECAIRAGSLLTQAKALVQHGEWEQWLQKHVTCAARTAQAYMRLYQKHRMLPAPEAQRVALLPLREAMKAIATPPKGDTPRRDPYMRVTKRSEGLRVYEALIDAATNVRKFAKNVEANYIRRKDCERLKKELIDALDALQRLVDHCDAPTDEAVIVDLDDVLPLLDELDVATGKNHALCSTSEVMRVTANLMYHFATEAQVRMAKAKNTYPVILFNDMFVIVNGMKYTLNPSAINAVFQMLIAEAKKGNGYTPERAASAAKELRQLVEVQP